MATMFNQRWRNLTLAAAVTATLAACGGGGGGGGNNPPNNPPAATPGNTVAVTTMNRVVTFNRTTTNQQIQIATAVAITNLAAGDNVVGFDVRPQTNELIVLTNTSAGVGKIYTVNATTGAAANPITLVNSPMNVAPVAFTALNGTNFGVDFNPVPDRLRIVSDTGQNLRVNVANGQTIVDGTLNGASTKATEVAYNNNAANACRTTLFYIDPTTNMLFNTTNPNGGVLTAVGPLGVTSVGSNLGFEVITSPDGMTNNAIAAINVQAGPQLYNIALGTGAATIVGSITGLMANEQIRGIGAITPAAVTQLPGDLVGLTDDNRLFSFNAAAPNKLCTGPTAIAPLLANETVVGIDTRPVNGSVYGVGVSGTAGRVFVIDKATGAVTAPQNITAAGTAVTIAGTSFGVDFNPVPDRLRVTSDTGQNLRINVTDGTTNVDGNINITPAATVAVTAAAYTNSFGPSAPSTTTLFTIDSAAGTLNVQNPPNNGTQVPVGSLGIAGGITGVSGFDINGANNTAVAGLTVTGGAATTLYNINLTTGAATAVAGNIGAGVGVGTAPLTARVRGMTLNANPQSTLAAITADNKVVTFNAATPGTFATNVSITGLQGGENIIGADYRPANGQLYALTDAARTYIINTTTGMATSMNAFLADPADATLPFTNLVGGGSFGVDFNPVPDRLRTVASANLLNLRSNVDTNGVTITDTLLNRAPVALANAPQVTAAAYTNSFGPSPAPAGSLTTLFVIDTANDRLFVQSPPNNGSLVNVGALGIDATAVSGFEIIGSSTAIAALSTATASNVLYNINLATGAATPVAAGAAGTIAVPMGSTVTALAGAIFTPTAGALTPPASTSVIAITNDTGGGQSIVTFALNAPNAGGSVGISGIPMGELIVGADFRPANGLLYALTTAGNIYTVGVSGAATGVATLAATISGATLTGTNFAVDFNPVPDRLRIVSDTGQNLRVNIEGAAPNTIIDGATNVLSPAPTAAGAAYTNSFAPSPIVGGATTLYVLDTATNALQIQNPPNDGTLNVVGRLDPTQTFTTTAGFDIGGGANGLVLAALQPTGATQSTLYRIDLATGVATPVGLIGPAGTMLVSSLSVKVQ